MSTFIGRSQETAELTRLLAERRLLTLAGPGGSGKTRLALHVAETVLPRFADGVWLVDLAPLHEGALVAQTVAGVLGVRELAGTSLEQALNEYLHHRSMLLVFDNCEHLVEASARLAENILEASPNIRVLATSREPLGVAGEVVYRVPPLSVPQPLPWQKPIDEQTVLAAYREAEAVQLFLDRAAAILPDYRLTTLNAPWIGRICRRLDGMPLAIELAAARLPTLSAREIAERLDDRFALLASRFNTGIPRHKSLEAMLDWSHDLLSEPEQTLFRRLAVFSGGWTLEAAEQICGFGNLAPAGVMDLLESLVSRSMVVANASTATGRRFSFLESIHDYARRKLEAAGETGLLRRRHFDFFVHWTEAHTPLGFGSEQQLWLSLLTSDWANLRSALNWGEQQETLRNETLRLAIACNAFMDTRGILGEARKHLQALLAGSTGQESIELRTRALLDASILAYYQGDYSAAIMLAEEALPLSRRMGDPGKALQARSLMHIGDYSKDLGNYDRARISLEEALAIYHELGSEREAVAIGLLLLGSVAMRVGDYTRAEKVFAETLADDNRPEAPANLAWVFASLGELSLRRERYDEAQALLEQSLAIREALDMQWSVADVLGTLGWVALEQKNFDQARRLLRRSIELRLEIGESGRLAWCLGKLAEVIIIEAQFLPPAMRRDKHTQSARVFGAAAALRASHNSVVDPVDQANYDRLLIELRQSLGDQVFAEAWAHGEVLPITEIIDLALTPVVLPDDVADQLRYGGLSLRERETAALVAQGKTNREIAVAMTVGERTVETYVTRILNKLAFDSRVQIATWAHERGLDGPDSGQHPQTTPIE